MLTPAPILRHLRRADPILGRVIESIGPLDITPRPGGFHFLARSIYHQSLSGAAAETILRRTLACAGVRRLTPACFRTFTDTQLIACGLSRPKIGYLRGLAETVLAGELSFRRLARLSDQSVTMELTKIKGIGAWSADMYLMFVLNRPDIFPGLDAGIRNAVCELYDIPRDRFPADSPAIAEPWRPYRSIASRYLWSWLDSK